MDDSSSNGNNMDGKSMERTPPAYRRQLGVGLAAVLCTLLGSSSLTLGGMLDTPLPTFSDGKAAERVGLIPAVVKNNEVETDVICTNLDTVAVNVGLEVFDKSGVLANQIALPPTGNGEILNVPVGATVTIGTGGTPLLTENLVISGLPDLRNGSGRVVATTKNIACIAMLVDRLHEIVDPLINNQIKPPTLAPVPVWSCGNSRVDPFEQCDDGNSVAGDGCDATCQVEGTTSTTTTTTVPTTTTTLPPGTQTILGKSFLVKDPRPLGAPTGGNPDKRAVVILGKEGNSDNTVSGDPIANGVTITIFANGRTATSQIIQVPGGAKPPGPVHGWKAAGGGFKFSNPTKAGSAPGIPVKSVLIKKTPSGTFLLKVALSGKLQGAVDVVPPGPGTDGGMVLAIGGGATYCVNFGGAAGGKVINGPGAGIFLPKVFKITRPTTEAGCPGP
jgi:cysteine-rich repeat protein